MDKENISQREKIVLDTENISSPSYSNQTPDSEEETLDYSSLNSKLLDFEAKAKRLMNSLEYSRSKVEEMIDSIDEVLSRTKK